MTHSPHTATILLYADTNVPPAEIATTLAVSLSTVYNVLRAERPKRARSPRSRTSEKRTRVVALLKEGHDIATVALLVGVSRQYCYRIQGESR